MRYLTVFASTLAIVAALATMTLPGSAATRVIPVVDLTGPFLAAADPSSGTIDTRIQRFKDDLLYRYPEVFDQSFMLLDDPHLAWYLTSVAPTVSQLRAYAPTLQGDLLTYEGAFENAFPKFDPQGTTIYLMPSFGEFDGMTQEIGGKPVLFLGLENVYQERKWIPIIATHELFHIYHHEINPAFFATPSENDLYHFGIWRELWAEGMAVYVSQRLNPGTTEFEALGSRELAALAGKDLARLACTVDSKLDSTDEGDSALLFAGGHPPGLPQRGGYLIGYLAAKELGQTYTLAQLADLQGPSLRAQVGTIVGRLCNNGS